jgi:Holliday junction resolvase RusA-like endonuclease
VSAVSVDVGTPVATRARAREAITFTVEGKPVPWARSRHNGRQHFTPAHVRQYSHLVYLRATEQLQGAAPLDGPVRLWVVAYMPVPKSWPKYRRRQALDGHVHHTSKPDADNLIKVVKDALNSVVYGDDSQVADQRCVKAYSDRPRVVVTVTPLVDGAQDGFVVEGAEV